MSDYQVHSASSLASFGANEMVPIVVQSTKRTRRSSSRTRPGQSSEPVSVPSVAESTPRSLEEGREPPLAVVVHPIAHLDPRVEPVEPIRVVTPAEPIQAFKPTEPIQAVSSKPIETYVAPTPVQAKPILSTRPVELTTPVDSRPTVQSGEAFTDTYTVLPEINRLFRTDSAREFQNRVKPLTAPFLDDRVVDLSRATQRLYIYLYESLARQDWYDFMTRVIGLARRPESEFITMQTLPTVRDSEPLITGGDVANRRFADMNFQRTPITSSLFPDGPGSSGFAPSGPAPIPAPVPAPEPVAFVSTPDDDEMASMSMGTLERRANGQRPVPRAIPPRQVFQTIAAQVREIVPDLNTILSGERFSDIRRRIDALHNDDQEYQRRFADAEASDIRRDMRRALGANNPWLTDPLQATGFVIFNPLYVGAKSQALSLIHRYCAGTSLAGVPEREFIRRRPLRKLPDGRNDDKWETVRMMFATLVADIFLHRRMKAGSGVRYANDLDAMTRDINALLRDFVYTVGYDNRQGYETFYIVDPRNDERRQPVYLRASELRYTPYESVLGPSYADGTNAPSIANRRSRITLQMLSQN